MTRPKSARQAAKKGPYAGLPILKKQRVRMSPKYAVNITLYDADRVYPISCVWDPKLPSALEMEMFHDRLQEELAPFFQTAGLHAGFLSGGAI
jgi:hypothetical protein